VSGDSRGRGQHRIVTGRLRWRIGRRAAAAIATAALAAAFASWQAIGAGAQGSTVTITPAPPFTTSDLTAPAGANWIVVHGNLAAWNYSSLNQITTSNVSGLQPAWSTALGGICTPTNSACGGEGNALVYDGVMYMEDGAGSTVAIDAATGNHIWSYTPTYDPAFKRTGDVTRGIALGGGQLYIPREDGSLVALNQETGTVAWQDDLGPWQLAYAITAPPVYYNGVVYVGMSGGDSGNSDFMVAVDATSGAVLWRWNVIPSPGQPGYKTWGGSQEYHFGGGAIWDAVSIDPKLGLLYFGTGNPVPWNTRPKGKELYTDAIVALHVDTGKLAWAYQTVHHDVWDDDIPSTPILYDAKYRPYKILKAGTWVDNPAQGFYGSHAVGVKFKYTGPAVMEPAVALASKMGFMYILNRKTGKPLIPTPEMKVDQTGAAGLDLSPTQPIPAVGKYFTSACVLPSQWTAPGPDGNPVQHGCTFTPVGFTHFVAIPHDEGEWMPSALDPTTGTLYTCTIDNRAWAMEAVPAAQQQALLKPGAGYTGILLTQGVRVGYTGGFTATKLTTNQEPWRDNWPDFCYSGATTTAGGLVFAGHNDGSIEAMNSATGTSLYRSPATAAGANAPVITYEVNGKQYVSVFAGGNGHENTTRGDYIYTYALP
jgi:quinohemoprotein ethanol dehydrogenase